MNGLTICPGNTPAPLGDWCYLLLKIGGGMCLIGEQMVCAEHCPLCCAPRFFLCPVSSCSSNPGLELNASNLLFFVGFKLYIWYKKMRFVGFPAQCFSIFPPSPESWAAPSAAPSYGASSARPNTAIACKTAAAHK